MHIFLSRQYMATAMQSSPVNKKGLWIKLSLCSELPQDGSNEALATGIDFTIIAVFSKVQGVQPAALVQCYEETW